MENRNFVVPIEISSTLVLSPCGQPVGLRVLMGGRCIGWVWCVAFLPTNSQN